MRNHENQIVAPTLIPLLTVGWRVGTLADWQSGNPPVCQSADCQMQSAVWGKSAPPHSYHRQVGYLVIPGDKPGAVSEERAMLGRAPQKLYRLLKKDFHLRKCRE